MRYSVVRPQTAPPCPVPTGAIFTGEALKEDSRMGFRSRFPGRLVGVAVAAAGFGLWAASAPPCRAQESAKDNTQTTRPGETIVSRIDLVDADLDRAVSLLKAQTGVDLVIEKGDAPYKLVTLSLTNKP